MKKYHCPKCDKETEHKHLHDAAHGIEGTHMSGSERYSCTECKHNTYASKEGVERGMKFILDEVPK